MSQPVRIGFIGAGGICRSRHLPNLRNIEGVEIAVVCNRSRESSEAVAQEFEIPEVADDWRQLLQRSDIDAVFIGTWPYMHKQMSIATLEAGKHCFCQARMAMDLAEAKQMLYAARQHPRLVNMVCPPPTRMPNEPFIRKLIQQGQLGQLCSVELVVNSAVNRDPRSITWRERGEFSGRQIMSMGIWAETLNAWLGCYESLAACHATPLPVKTGERSRPVSIDVPQVVLIQGRLSGGALISEYYNGLVADETTRGDRLTIHGLEGTLRLEGDSVELGLANKPLKPVQVPAELQRPWQVEQDFVDAVRAAREGRNWRVSPDFEESLLYMRKVEAVHVSAALSQAVDPAAL